jgi:hypothetical protein
MVMVVCSTSRPASAATGTSAEAPPLPVGKDDREDATECDADEPLQPTAARQINKDEARYDMTARALGDPWRR